MTGRINRWGTCNRYTWRLQDWFMICLVIEDRLIPLIQSPRGKSFKSNIIYPCVFFFVPFYCHKKENLKNSTSNLYVGLSILPPLNMQIQWSPTKTFIKIWTLSLDKLNGALLTKRLDLWLLLYNIKWISSTASIGKILACNDIPTRALL